MERQNSYREAFLASLSRRTAAPSDNWPTVRCWTKYSFDHIFRQIKEEIGAPRPSQSNIAILNWIMKLGLACAIETDTEVFYLLEIGANPESEIDPSELMMAFQPTGVICYFSAISFHSLTSQLPSHHHVAILTDVDRIERKIEAPPEVVVENLPAETIAKTTEENTHARTRPSPFGTNAFSYAGVPYYLTSRTKRLVPGVQERINGPRARFRMTTLEQTLLDTLHKPQNCGGAAVVLEAWQEAIASRRIDEERLAVYLTQMNYPSTTRRLGAMLHRLEYTQGKKLGDFLTQAKENVQRTNPSSQISLLPGFGYSNLDKDWLVRIP